MSRALVIIPTYNEKENIVDIVNAVLALPECFHVLVVDDNSPDGTADLIKTLRKNKYSDTLFLIERGGKFGLGPAYILGFQWGLEKGYDYIFEMDADFSHNPKYLPKLLSVCRNGGADFAIGSRYVKGGSVKNWDYGRILISKMGSLYTRMITFMPIRDTTAGFMCYTRKVLENINLKGIIFKGYAFQIEMKFAALKLGFKCNEIPIDFVDRKQGVSKMNKNIVNEAIKGVIYLQLYYLFGNYLKKIRKQN